MHKILKLTFLIAAFQLLTACGGSTYNRSYIVSDAANPEVVSESAEERQ